MDKYTRKNTNKNTMKVINKSFGKTLQKTLCYTLILSLLLQTNTLTAAAGTQADSAPMTPQTTDNDRSAMEENGLTPTGPEVSQGEETPFQPEVLGEIEEKRDTFSKEYLLSDNS